MRLLFYALGLSAALAWGCQKAEPTSEAEEESSEEAEQAEEGEEAEAEAGEAGAHGDSQHKGTHGEASNQSRFAVPFAWEASDEEPLARTRAFLKDVVRDNEANVRRGPSYFQTFKDKQTPRATILTCADSRVQTGAWDSTPDNDNFQIRNIGNLVKTAEGSIEYGVEHLHTPLFLVIGHTGCGAVKAAMGDTSKLSAPIQGELKSMTVPKAQNPESIGNAEWAEAVVKNVHTQVELAVQLFAKEVAEQKLTVVGAVYDFRGDLGEPGTLHLVNVNANVDPQRLGAFTRAVGGHVRNETGSDDPTTGLLARVAQAARELAESEGAAEHSHSTASQLGAVLEKHGAGPAKGAAQPKGAPKVAPTAPAAAPASAPQKSGAKSEAGAATPTAMNSAVR